MITMLDDVSTDELSRTAEEAIIGRRRGPRAGRGCRWAADGDLHRVRRAAVPDPRPSRCSNPADAASSATLLVTHIFLGSVALRAACLAGLAVASALPLAIHRWSGRIYVAAALTASVCVMIISPMGLMAPISASRTPCLRCCGSGQRWPAFRAIRQRRFADHRQWMLRSVALAFSIVAFRVWMFIAFAVFVPGIYTGAEVDPAALNRRLESPAG